MLDVAFPKVEQQTIVVASPLVIGGFCGRGRDAKETALFGGLHFRNGGSGGLLENFVGGVVSAILGG